MIKVLDSTKTLTQLVSDTSNGLGQLNVMNDSVTEELNGIYELEFDILTTDKHYEDLKTHMLVKVNVDETDDEQIFRVYKITEPINFVSHVFCQHITYDLNKIVVKPFEATGAVLAKNNMISHILGNYPFTMSTDISNTTSVFKLDIPRSFRECLGGYEGSLLDTFRGEYQWDNLEVKMLARRGSDHGTRISYGKNLTDFQQEENNENVYDAVYGYAVVDETTYEASNIYNKTGASFPRVLNVDFSDRYESGDVPTSAELLQYATTYATNNDIEVPNVNIQISFVPLWQTEEYKNIAPLERVFLGDTVHVFFEKLNVEASSRVIKTVWSPSLKRWEEIELGSARANLNTVINDAVTEATESIADSISVDTGYLEQEMADLSKLIINGLGLYRTEQQVSGGGVRIILHNKPTLAASDVQYYMSASGIMVSTDYGVTWNAGYDTSTGELYTQALSTIILKALEIYGSVITFGDENDKYITASVYTDSNDDPLGVSFDGSGTVRFQPQEAFYINNIASDGTHYFNRFMMSKQGINSNNYTEWLNYDDDNGYLLANFLELDAHYVYNNVTMNRSIIHNYSTYSGTRYEGNYFILASSEHYNNSQFYNYKLLQTPGSALIANQLSLICNDSDARTRIQLLNYKYSSDANANYITLQGEANANMMWITNRQISSDNTSNGIYAYSDSTTTTNYLQMVNNIYGSGNNGNLIKMIVNSSGNTFELSNFDTTGTTVKNTIKMSSDETTTVWSASDLRLRSSGAVRIFANTTSGAPNGDYYQYASGQQDAYIGGYSLKLQCINRIYLYWGSTRYYLGVSNGVVTATQA